MKNPWDHGNPRNPSQRPFCSCRNLAMVFVNINNVYIKENKFLLCYFHSMHVCSINQASQPFLGSCLIAKANEGVHVSDLNFFFFVKVRRRKKKLVTQKMVLVSFNKNFLGRYPNCFLKRAR